jgi:hypothetical protein
VNTLGAVIEVSDVALISTPPLTQYGTLNYPCAQTKLARASDDENSGSPFVNPENVVDEI